VIKAAKRSLKSKSKKPEDGGQNLFAPGAETYNPTPLQYHPTRKPSNERRALKKAKPEDGGQNLFAPGAETYNPTPLQYHPTRKPSNERRVLKKEEKPADGGESKLLLDLPALLTVAFCASSFPLEHLHFLTEVTTHSHALFSYSFSFSYYSLLLPQSSSMTARRRTTPLRCSTTPPASPATSAVL